MCKVDANRSVSCWPGMIRNHFTLLCHLLLLTVKLFDKNEVIDRQIVSSGQIVGLSVMLVGQVS